MTANATSSWYAITRYPVTLWPPLLNGGCQLTCAAWLPGSEGEGVADVLFRSTGREHHDFTGRLAFSWPETALPVTYDAAGNVSGAVFPRGWGLDYHSMVNSRQLSEDPRIPPHWVASQGSLFHAGHVTAPWSIFVADGSAEVHLTTARQESPQGAVVADAKDITSFAGWRNYRNVELKESQ